MTSAALSEPEPANARAGVEASCPHETELGEYSNRGWSGSAEVRTERLQGGAAQEPTPGGVAPPCQQSTPQHYDGSPSCAGGDAPEPQPRRNSDDLWVAVKGAPSVLLGKASGVSAIEETTREEPNRGAAEPRSMHGEAETALERRLSAVKVSPGVSGTTSLDEDTFIKVDHEDVIDAVADYVKERIRSHDLLDSALPTDVAKAVDTAIADEVQGGWRRVWGKGRLLFRSSEALSKGSKSLTAELGPDGRTGQVLRCVSQKAIQGSSKALKAIRSAAVDSGGGTSAGPPS